MPSEHEDLTDILELRDPQLDAIKLQETVAANLARRRAAGAYREDLDSLARSLLGDRPPIFEEMHSSPATLRGLLAELEAAWTLQEQPFVSHVPFFAPLIVAVRNFWNWMSTKWYVRPILQEQMTFNVLAVRAIAEVATACQQLERRLQAVEEALRQGQVDEESEGEQ